MIVIYRTQSERALAIRYAERNRPYLVRVTAT
jgi:hypothetical protein